MPSGIAGNAALTIAFQGLGALATLATGIAVARTLGPGGRGVFAYAVVSLGMLMQFAQGASAAVIAQYKVQGLPSTLVHRAMLWIIGGFSLLLGSVTAACGFLLPGQRPLLAVALALPFAQYVAAATSFLVADGLVQRANAVNALNVIGLTACVLPLVGIGHVSIGVVLAAWVACYVLSAGVAQRWTRRYAQGAVDAEDLRATVAAQFRFGLKSSAVYAAGYLNTRIDLFIVAAILGPTALGLYALAISFGELMWKWSDALNWSSFGRLAGDAMESTSELAAKLTRTILVLQGACAIVLFAIAPWLITTVYGMKFAGAVAPFRMLLPGIVAFSLETSFGYLLMVRFGRPMLVLGIQGSSAVICATLTLLLMPRYGLVGAAFASSATYITATVATAIVVVNVTRANVLRFIVPTWDDFRRPARSLQEAVIRISSSVFRRA